MPDDEQNKNLTALDSEPATGTQSQQNNPVRPEEHADIRHRIGDHADSEATANTGHPEPRSTFGTRTLEPISRYNNQGDAYQAPVQPTQQPHVEPQQQPQSTPSQAPVPPAVPTAPVATAAGTESELPKPSPGLLVLQWLVYALWGWTLLTLSGLIYIIVSQFMFRSERGFVESWLVSGIAYFLAAAIVLFIIALICDIFYAKAERRHARTPAANVIMIIHTVLFALFGVGSLIISVFGMVELMVGNSPDTSGALTGIVTGAIGFILYAFTLVRTLRPKWLAGVVTAYWIFMSLVVGISIIAGVVGPAAHARLAAQDEATEKGVKSVSNKINQHARLNGKLPATLKDLGIQDSYSEKDAYSLIASNKIKYTPGERLDEIDEEEPVPMDSEDILFRYNKPDKPVYAYELCVTYATSTGQQESSYYDDYGYGDLDRPSTYIETYSHPKGEVCYDVATDSIY
jgi:hypothetical protein